MDEYNNFQKKTLPHDPEAERSIISSMICEMGAAIYANENLNANDFYNQAHKIIFDTINDLILENKKIDIITLNNKLEEKDLLKEIGGREFIINLASEFYTSANLTEHVKIIKNKPY